MILYVLRGYCMATKQCISCGKRIVEKSTICPYCGESQDKSMSDMVSDNSQGSKKNKINQNMAVCKTCGEQVSKNAKSCPHCGELLQEEREKKKKTSIWTWLILLLFIGYVVGEVGSESKENTYASEPSTYTKKRTDRRNSGCSVGDFTIKQSSGWMEGRYYKIPFSVTNNCAKSAGVKIQMSFYGKDGTLLNAMTGWPASVNNISPGETYNDVWLETVYQGVERVTFKAVDVKVW